MLKSFAQARVIHGFADSRDLHETFDFVVSLSVLEHVKYLKSFFDFAVRHTVSGGTNIHLYDLGHALYPSSLQERLHVLACRLPVISALVPQSYWATYLSLQTVESVAKENGFTCQKITYHNCPNHVQVIKHISQEEDARLFLEYTNTFEQRASELYCGSQESKERLFPSITFWLNKG